MKYIPGITFTVGKPTKPKQGGSVLQQRTEINRSARAPEFKAHNTYVLEKIIVNSKVEKIAYHFRNQTTGEAIVKEYLKLEEADNLIDSFMG